MSLGSNRPTALIHQYGALYSETRLDALDSLDSLPQLAELENLKNKLLFSVIVVSGRTRVASNTLHYPIVTIFKP